MTQWTARAVFENKAVMTFGLSAPDAGRAMLAALDRVPRTPEVITVQPLAPPPGKGSATYAEHQKHQGHSDGCRFCV